MGRPSPRLLAQVLAGLAFPADRWQVLAHVDHYGPDRGTRHLFWQLPEQSYRSIGAVLAALGALDGPRESGGAPDAVAR
jgi:hypothetical protein